ncbi:hypothetical protein L596_021041 [Steinernema carpocapsae]|uniref:G-protein coupled receptors family 1 profile domain-containing protein n=1 Tax=Steinernema carpocapsae TaxID=34508 RepID=A0A4U5MVI2_STECR|nr:hypothetical protein L596_021041 [Steinernema carpocapsae]
MLPTYFLFILTVYCSVFFVGFAGNIWVIITLLFIRNNKNHPISWRFRRVTSYVLALSITDLLVLSMIPMLVHYFLSSQWYFGYFMCKVFWTIENVNKLLSVAILSFMSVERYMGVCRPLNRSFSRNCSVVLIISLCLIFITALCFPILYYSGTAHYGVWKNETLEVRTACNSNLPDRVLPFFITYMFTLGYVAPAVCITICYLLIVRQVKEKIIMSRRNSVTQANKLVHSVSWVVLFHFVCWTPFWTMVLVTLVNTTKFFGTSVAVSETFAMVKVLTSFLPYINSAGNWIFYALLNRKIQGISREIRNRQMQKFQNSFIRKKFSRVGSNKERRIRDV